MCERVKEGVGGSDWVWVGTWRYGRACGGTEGCVGVQKKHR